MCWLMLKHNRIKSLDSGCSFQCCFSLRHKVLLAGAAVVSTSVNAGVTGAGKATCCRRASAMAGGAQQSPLPRLHLQRWQRPPHNLERFAPATASSSTYSLPRCGRRGRKTWTCSHERAGPPICWVHTSPRL
jgi:hypothetical protein